MIYTTYYFSPIGKILLACQDDRLIGLWIEGQKYYLGSINCEIIEKDDEKIFVQTKKWLDRYFMGEQPNINELALAPLGNEFRQTVWRLLCEIPYGKITTYGELATKAAKIMNKKSMSAQAIGGAISHNPISIIIPCHRVVGSNGSLTGYAGGIEKKIKLLMLENVDMKDFYIPAQGTAL